MNSIPSRKMGTYHTLYPPAAAIALARAALAPSSARVASPSSSTMCADARYLQPREAWREAWARGREDARGGRAPPPPPPPPARALRRTNASIVAIVHAPSPARRLTRHLCSSFGREDGPRARRGRGRVAGPRARAGRSCAPFPPLGGERRPRRRLVRELADREEEEDGGLQPRERLGGVRLGLHLVELELARCAAVVAQVARAAHLVQVSAQEGAQVGLRQLAARAEQLVQVVPAVVRA